MTTVKPAELADGVEIDAGPLGPLTVTEVYTDVPPGAEIEVDVQPGPGADIWDVEALASAAGARAAQWLKGTGYPRLRYRLYYPPDTDVKVTSP